MIIKWNRSSSKKKKKSHFRSLQSLFCSLSFLDSLQVFFSAKFSLWNCEFHDETNNILFITEFPKALDSAWSMIYTRNTSWIHLWKIGMEPLFELKLSVIRFLNHVTIDIGTTDISLWGDVLCIAGYMVAFLIST